MTAITFERGGGPVEYTIEDGEWWVSWDERNIEYTDEQLARARFGGIVLPDEQRMTTQLSEKQLFSSLNPEELRLLLGYCAHVTEHGSHHVGELVSAMNEADSGFGTVDFAALRKLNLELDQCLSAIECAGVTGKAIFAFFDEHEAVSS